MTWSVAVACLLILLTATAGVYLQWHGAERAALLEAEHVGKAVSNSGIDNAIDHPDALQRYVNGVQDVYERDLAVFDVLGRLVVKADPEGDLPDFAGESLSQISGTMADGNTRTLLVRSRDSTASRRYVIVPMRALALDFDSPIIGAVVLDYTALFNTLTGEAQAAAYGIGGITLALVGIAIALGLKLADAISGPLAKLQNATFEIGKHNYAIRVDVQSHTEVRSLGQAFNEMAATLGANRKALSQREEQLKLQANALTLQASELEKSNKLLRDEMKKQQVAAERIEYLAYHDNLTGLPNRSMFGKLLTQAINQAKRHNRRAAVMFIDLDRFKPINDTLGHEVGDQVLQEVATRLKACLRESDTVARLGGDEFVVLLPELEAENSVDTVAQKILAAVAKPLSVVGQELRVSSSVGVSIFPAHGDDEQTLMKNADMAMYQAKDSGRSTYKLFSAELSSFSLERLALESSLRRAIDRDEMQLHYQAKKDLTTGAIQGMEALLRWQHPDLGTVAPSLFIPVAEETGLIVPIGRWVLRTACAQNVAWREAGLGDLVVAVNLSARQFTDNNLLKDIAQILNETGMKPTFLELEITESMMMADARGARETLGALRAMGIRIAIDDFGTGYSSLGNIRQFPIDTLKIDRSFVRDLESNEDDRGIAKAIIAMAKTLKLHLVAEGVETEGQYDFLQANACDEFQGYLFTKPLAASDFHDFIVAQRASHQSEALTV